MSQVTQAASEVWKWTTAGMPVPQPEDISFRLEVCAHCEFWDHEGFMGTGRCNKCGCSTQAKLRMATAKCPIDKWGPII